MTVLQVKWAANHRRLFPLVGVVPPVADCPEDIIIANRDSGCARSVEFASAGIQRQIHSYARAREILRCSRIRENSGIAVEGVQILTNPATRSARNLKYVPTGVGTTKELSKPACGQFGRSRCHGVCRSCQSGDSIRQEMHLHSAIRGGGFLWEPNRRKKAQKSLHRLIPATVLSESLRLRRIFASSHLKCVDQHDLTQG